MINRVMLIEGDRRRIFDCHNINDAHWLYEKLVRQGLKNVFLLDPSGHQYRLGYDVISTPISISSDTIFIGPAAERLKSEIAAAALEQERLNAPATPRNAGRKPRSAEVQNRRKPRE